MTVAKEIKDKVELTLDEELAQLKAQKAFTPKEMERILEIEKINMSKLYETKRVEDIEASERKNNKSVIISKRTIPNGDGKGIKVVNH